MSDIKIVIFRRWIEHDGITLRMPRLRDLPVLHRLFGPEIFLTAGNIDHGRFNSVFSFRRWIVNTFQVVYLIEVEETGGRRIIGFVGLYSLRIGQSLWISTALFDGKDRGRGYGRHGLELLLDSLRNDGIAETVYAEVLNGNSRSMHLLRDLRFGVCGRREDRLVLAKRILSHP